MVSEAVVSGAVNIVAIAVVVGFIFTLLLPKKLHYIVNGIILLFLGGAHLMYEFYYLESNLTGSPIVRFVVAFVAASTAKELIGESLKEKGKIMKSTTFFIGIILILIVLLPELYHFGAINFDLPEYGILFSFLYIIGGLVAIIAPFFVQE